VAVAAPGGRRRWGAVLQHRGAGVSGGTQPQFHSGDMPSTAGFGQGIEEGVAQGDLAEEEGTWGRKMGPSCGWRLLKGRG
jgi:hypothetical protein